MPGASVEKQEVFQVIYALLRKGGAILLGAALLSAAVPASAQLYSDGYKFLKAVKDKDGNTVNELLQQPGTTVINARDKTSGETALHIAAGRRDLTWLTFLLGKGANANTARNDGVTPLMLCAQLGFTDGVEALAAAGARVDVSNSAGETPLIAAVHRRDVPLMRVLLKAGADPDRNDNSGRSARDYARLAGSTALLDELDRGDESGASKPVYGPSF